MMTHDDHAQVTAIATAFATRLMREVGPLKMAEIARLNAAEGNPNVCHSHDFCDANMPMSEAFEDVTGREPDPSSDADARLWDAAWAQARRSFGS